jgi:hypothetical protein
MGLFLAKEYIKNEGLSEAKGLPLEYKGSRITLEQNVRFVCPDDEYLELAYTGDELKVTYGNNDHLTINCSNGTLTFSFNETEKVSTDKRSITYPLTMVVSNVKIIRLTDKSQDIISRLMEYRD